MKKNCSNCAFLEEVEMPEGATPKVIYECSCACLRFMKVPGVAKFELIPVVFPPFNRCPNWQREKK